MVPAFHRQYYEAMASMFARCTQEAVVKLGAAVDASGDGAVFARRGRGRGSSAKRRAHALSLRMIGMLARAAGALEIEPHARSPVAAALSLPPPPPNPPGQTAVVDMEREFLNLGLDIIGARARSLLAPTGAGRAGCRQGAADAPPTHALPLHRPNLTQPINLNTPFPTKTKSKHNTNTNKQAWASSTTTLRPYAPSRRSYSRCTAC